MFHIVYIRHTNRNRYLSNNKTTHDMPTESVDYIAVIDTCKVVDDWPDDMNTYERVEICEGYLACHILFPDIMKEWYMEGDLGTGENSGVTTPVKQVPTTRVMIDEDLSMCNTDEVVFFKHLYQGLVEKNVSDVHNDENWNNEWFDKVAAWLA